MQPTSCQLSHYYYQPSLLLTKIERPFLNATSVFDDFNKNNDNIRFLFHKD